jgi:hypothetical protein
MLWMAMLEEMLLIPLNFDCQPWITMETAAMARTEVSTRGS